MAAQQVPSTLPTTRHSLGHSRSSYRFHVFKVTVPDRRVHQFVCLLRPVTSKAFMQLPVPANSAPSTATVNRQTSRSHEYKPSTTCPLPVVHVKMRVRTLTTTPISTTAATQLAAARARRPRTASTGPRSSTAGASRRRATAADCARPPRYRWWWPPPRRRCASHACVTTRAAADAPLAAAGMAREPQAPPPHRAPLGSRRIARRSR